MVKLDRLTCELEHDDDQRDRHPRHPAEDGRGPDHRVQAGRDARLALAALALKNRNPIFGKKNAKKNTKKTPQKARNQEFALTVSNTHLLCSWVDKIFRVDSKKR
jgi:hypothetical protein